jgi:hypothetical protein
VWPLTEQRITKMAQSVRSKADEQFAATQKKAKQAQKDKDKAWQELTDRVARQKAADQVAAEKLAAKSKKTKSAKKAS